MKNTYEIEIKSLLGSRENCEKLKKALLAKRPDMKLVTQSKQLNHYFTGGDVKELYKIKNFEHIIKNGQQISVRTRETDGKAIFVVKASIGSDTSANGVERLEFESVMPMTLDELDKLILDAGFNYEAKWSREREEYDTGDMHVCIDKNAGYGYLAEFEKVIADEARAGEASAELRAFMRELGVEELPQDRLERMFAHYNAHWPEYYGTDKIFVVE